MTYLHSLYLTFLIRVVYIRQNNIKHLTSYEEVKLCLYQYLSTEYYMSVIKETGDTSVCPSLIKTTPTRHSISQRHLSSPVPECPRAQACHNTDILKTTVEWTLSEYGDGSLALV